MDVFRKDDGTLNVVDRDSYQFNPERGLVVIDSPEVGLVALLPIGKQIPAGAATARSEIGAHGMKRLKTSSPHGTFYVHPMIDLFRP